MANSLSLGAGSPLSAAQVVGDQPQNFGSFAQGWGSAPKARRAERARSESGAPDLAAFLRRKYPHDTAKNVVADLARVGVAVDVSTVEKWVAMETRPDYGRTKGLALAYRHEFSIYVVGIRDPLVFPVLAAEMDAQLAREKAKLAKLLRVDCGNGEYGDENGGAE